MNNAEKFKSLFDIYATELWSMSEADFLKWLKEDVPDANVWDTISRQAAIDALSGTIKLKNSADTIAVRDYIQQVASKLNELPFEQSTLYGYDINHLAFIARILEKSHIEPNQLADYMKDVCAVYELMIKEMKENFEKVIKSYSEERKEE